MALFFSSLIERIIGNNIITETLRCLQIGRWHSYLSISQSGSYIHTMKVDEVQCCWTPAIFCFYSAEDKKSNRFGMV